MPIPGIGIHVGVTRKGLGTLFLLRCIEIKSTCAKVFVNISAPYFKRCSTNIPLAVGVYTFDVESGWFVGVKPRVIALCCAEAVLPGVGGKGSTTPSMIVGIIAPLEVQLDAG